MPKFVVTGWDDLAIAMLKAAGIDHTTVRRMVLDLEVGMPGKMYLDLYVDRDVLQVENLLRIDPGLAAGLVVERPAES